ncbi:DUF551 domain-containing protein [Klebsiella pneumoniae]
MSEFSRETLLNIIETDHVQCGDASALARIALAAMDSEPVAWLRNPDQGFHLPMLRLGSKDPNPNFVNEEFYPVYAVPQPAPVVPDEKDKTVDADDHPLLWSFNEGWNACRAAMLAAANCSIPMISDKWIPVSERLPESNGMYFGWDGKRVLEVYCFFGGFSANQFIHGEITHWMPLPAAPQEVK